MIPKGKRRIVTHHLTRAKAERKLAKLWQLQAEAKSNGTSASSTQLDARDRLRGYEISPETPLEVAHERYLAFKWAVVAPR